MKRILITGSAGFVGSHLVDHILANTDWQIVGIDSFRHRGDSIRVYQDPKRYHIFTHDLTTPISNILINKIGHIDYIINMASESHVGRSIDYPVPFCENNIKLVLNVLEYAREVRPQIFIQISTDEVYGPALNDINHKEWATILPSNPYSASKACQEALCISYWRTYGVPVILTNTMNMIGEGQDKEKFLPILISKIYRDCEVEIHGSNDIIGSRYYLHARNHADALLFLLNYNYAGPSRYYDCMDEVIKPDRYNIVGEMEVDNLQLAFMVSDLLRKPLKYKLVDFHAARPGHDRRYALDGDKLQKLGWRAPVPFRESLERIVNWTLEHKEWL